MSDDSNELHAIIARELVAAVTAKFGAEIAKIRAECRAEVEAEVKKIRREVTDLCAGILVDLRAAREEFARRRLEAADADPTRPLQ
jgi:hypothetical protein